VDTEKDILELSALAPERKQVPLKWPENPDGVMVELALPSDFGTADHAQLERDRIKFQQLRVRENLSPAEANTMDVLLDSMARRLIIGGPDEAVAALPSAVKQEVADRFFYPSESKLYDYVAQMPADQMERLYRLASSSPDSAGSTEDHPQSG
jgi:hypothetical protein